jgi:hypothetical protein
MTLSGVMLIVGIDFYPLMISKLKLMVKDQGHK